MITKGRDGPFSSIKRRREDASPWRCSTRTRGGGEETHWKIEDVISAVETLKDW